MAGLNIETLDDPVLLERVQSFRGGMDSFNTPELLPPDTSQIIQNMLVPDNFTLRTREGADSLKGTHAPSGGKIQAVCFFNPPAYSPAAVAVCGANLAAWSGSAWSAVAITGTTHWSTTSLMAMAQAVDQLYVSDGANPWVLWSGNGNATILGSNVGTGGGIGDPPNGATVIFWNGSRMFAAGFAGGLANYQPDTLMASLVLAPGNASWDNLLWSIRVGAGDGDPIIACAPMQNNWILVLKQKSLWLVFADPTATAASSWTVQRLTDSIGCVGRRAWAMNGNDIMFLAHDGIRSVRRMAIGVDEYEVVPPVSEPVKQYIDRINWAAASKVAAWRYKQWILFALPLDGTDSTQEPNNVLVFNTRTQTWMGLWTGWTPTQFATVYFNGAENLVFGDSAGLVNQWKDDHDLTVSATFLDNFFPYVPLVRSRTFQFQDPVAQKDPWYFEFRMINTNNQASVTFYTDDNPSPPVVGNATTPAPVVGTGLTLPFTLAGNQPFVGRFPLDQLPDCNQLYLEITAPTISTTFPGGRVIVTGGGLIEIKNFTIAAFLNTIQNQ